MKVSFDTILSAQSTGASFTSSPHEMEHAWMFSLIASWSGDAAGNFTLEVSHDNVTYVTLAGSTQAAGGAAGTKHWEYPDASYKYVRVAFTRSSGTGSVTATIMAKGV